MAVTLQEFIDRSTQQAKVGLVIPPSELELIANSLLPQVFEEASRELSDSLDVRLTKTISFTNGVGTLTSDVFTGYLENSDLYDASDPTKQYSFVPHWEDFIRVYDTRIGYYTVRNGTSIYVIEPGATYTEGSGLTGDLKLVVAGIAAIPASAGATIDAPLEFTNKAMDLMVERLRGMVVSEVSG